MLTYSDLSTLRDDLLSTLKRLPDGASPETIAGACTMATISALDGRGLISMPPPLHDALWALNLPSSSAKRRLHDALELAAEAIQSHDTLDKAGVAGGALRERVSCVLAKHEHLLKQFSEVSQERDRAITARNHLESTMTEDAKRHDAKVAEMQDELDGTKRSGDHYFGIVQKFGKTIAEQKARIKELEDEVTRLTTNQSATIQHLNSVVDHWKTRAENRYARIDILEGENKRLRAALQATKDAADAALAVRAADPLT